MRVLTAKARILDFSIRKFNPNAIRLERNEEIGPIIKTPRTPAIRTVPNGTINCFITAGI